MDTTEAQVYKVMPGIKFGELIPVFETGNIDTIAYAGTSCEFYWWNNHINRGRIKSLPIQHSKILVFGRT